MAAYEIPNLRFSGEAGSTIARRRFVTFNSLEQVIQVSGNTDTIVGGSSLPAAPGEVAEVYDGIVMIEAGGPVVAGAAIMADDQGRAVAYAAADGVVQAGVAVTNAAAAGELCSVKI